MGEAEGRSLNPTAALPGDGRTDGRTERRRGQVDFEAMGREKRGWGKRDMLLSPSLTWVILGGEAVGVVLRGIDGPQSHSPPPWPALLQVASNPEGKKRFTHIPPKKELNNIALWAAVLKWVGARMPEGEKKIGNTFIQHKKVADSVPRQLRRLREKIMCDFMQVHIAGLHNILGGFEDETGKPRCFTVFLR